ncbi:hypothetical protein [Mesorhizobium sp.]|uniref:hypothetical protein n=1 Tax=Mesorhizobium sp. TaxID=1871066 RepID=UPI000FE5E4A9|nr:hypothetical protein [Mesorhizobium sp.]RWC52810.1 MAG: hypothetical protein EOS56_31605 [Mesorhizobium sp.]RWC53229.1 MAG: hypothetical protein EOS29_30000 [Mesorhizobium sp.]
MDRLAAAGTGLCGRAAHRPGGKRGALTFAGNADALESLSGIRIVPDRTGWPASGMLAPVGDRRQPAKALDETLRAIAVRYGARTADFVAMQLEYPGPRASP